MEKALKEIVQKLWQAPAVEYLGMTGNIQKSITFDNLLKKLNVNEHLEIQPAVILSILGSVDDKNVNKIKLNKYQGYTNQLQVKINLPEVITDKTEFHFEQIKVKRHPQLRRILTEYFNLIEEPFDQTSLAARLDNLMVDNSAYTFEDADELVLRLNPMGTFFESMPQELINLIISYIDQKKRLNLQELHKKDHPVLKLIENITDKVLTEKNASVMDIYTEMNKQGQIDQLIKNTSPQPADFFKSVVSDVGLNNIFKLVKERSDFK